MPANTASLKRDNQNNLPAQHFDAAADAYDYRTGAGGAADVRVPDGADEALGATTDEAAVNLSAPATAVALLRRIANDMAEALTTFQNY